MTKLGPTSRGSRGLTLIELLMGLMITGIIGAAVASMLHAAAYGTSQANDARASLVRERTTAVRLAAAIRGAREVVSLQQSGDSTVLVLWVNDDDDNGSPDVDEQRTITWSGGTITSKVGSAAAQMWATGVAAWDVSLNADETLVMFRLKLPAEGESAGDTLIGAAALRNTNDE